MAKAPMLPFGKEWDEGLVVPPREGKGRASVPKSPQPPRRTLTVREYEANSLAPNTRYDYARWTRQWSTWCQRNGIDPMPPDEEAFKRYIVERMAKGDKPSTIDNRHKGVRWTAKQEGHAEALDSPGMRNFMSGLRRQHGVASKQAKGVRAKHMAQLKLRAAPADMGFVALVAMMRDAGLRRNEMLNVRVGDIAPQDDGSGRLTIRRSKTDQLGKGAVAYLSPATMDLLSPLGSNPHRKLCPHSIVWVHDRFKRVFREAGLGTEFSSHSPRVGMAQDLAAGGATLAEIMQWGRWTTPAMAMRYIENIEAGNNAAAKFYEGTL